MDNENGAADGGAPDGGAPNPGEGGSGGQPEGGQPPAGDWLSNLTPDSRAALGPKNFSSVQDLAKAYLELEPKISAKGVILPGEKATDDERSAFFNAIGRPEKVEDYDLGEFKPPEGLPWDEEAASSFLKDAHAGGFTNDQVQRAITWYGNYITEAWNRQQEEEANEAATSEAALRKDLGQAYDAKMDLANRVVAQFGGADLVDELEKTGLGRRTNLVRTFIKIGEQFAEDGNLPGGEITNFAKTPAEAKAEKERLKGDPEFQKVFTDRQHPEHKQAVQRMNALNEMIRGDR